MGFAKVYSVMTYEITGGKYLIDMTSQKQLYFFSSDHESSVFFIIDSTTKNPKVLKVVGSLNYKPWQNSLSCYKLIFPYTFCSALKLINPFSCGVNHFFPV